MLNELKNAWKTAIESVLHDMAAGADIPALSMGLPPKSEMGDVAFPMFPYAKALHKSPAAIASDVIGRLENSHPDGEMSASGPYLNVRFDIPRLADRIMEASERGGDRYGFSEEGKGRRVMVEFSCPNTNKPLHLGHMRNDSLGEAVSALIKATGAEVMKVNLIAVLVLVGLAFGVQPLIGYNYGAKNSKRLKDILKFSYGFECGTAAVLALLLSVAAPALIKIFMQDPGIIELGVPMLRFQQAGMIFIAVVLVTTSTFQSAGKALGAFLLSVSRQGVIFAIVIFLASKTFGYNGVLASQAVSDCLTAILAAVLLFQWIHKEKGSIF